MLKFFQKHKYWLIIPILLILAFLIFTLAQESNAKQKLTQHYNLPITSKCGIGGARASEPVFEVTPTLFGYNYEVENSKHIVVLGSISFSGNIHEKSFEALHCELQ